MTESSSPARPGLPALWVRLIAGWILAGACFKLFRGTPADLPRVVRDLPLELGLTYKLAITAELAIAFVALFRPRRGWALELLLLLAFDAVLITQIARGEASCGCFGSSLKVPPWLMLAIDSLLLVGLFAARPWSRLPRREAHWLAPLAAVAVAALLPWIFDREVGPGEVVADGKPVEGAWTELAVENWVGQEIWDTPLGKPPLSEYVDVTQLPLDGLWVFWRSTCEHCAKHLEHLARTETGEHLITLLRLEEPTDTEANRVVHVMPDGNFVQQALLPAGITYVITTPAELLLEGGKIVAAREAVTPETGLLAEDR